MKHLFKSRTLWAHETETLSEEIKTLCEAACYKNAMPLTYDQVCLVREVTNNRMEEYTIIE